MFLLLLLFYILCLVFIYKARSISMDSMKVEFIKSQIENYNVSDISSLKEYLLDLGANLIYPDSSFINFTSPSNQNIPLNMLDSSNYQNVLNMLINSGDKNNFTNLENYLKMSKINYSALYNSKKYVIKANVKEISSRNDISNKSLVFYNREYTNRTTNVRYHPFYDSKTIDTNTKLGFQDWKKKFPELLDFFNESDRFKTTEDMNMNPLNLNLLTGFYNGEGYHYDFPTYRKENDYNYKLYNKTITEIFREIESPSQDDYNLFSKYSIITQNTRCLIVLFTLYLWNSEEFSNVILVFKNFNQSFEFLPTGILLPHAPKIKIFKANIYSSDLLFTVDILRCIIIIVLFQFLIIEIIEKKEEFKRDLFQTISMKMFYSLFTILIFITNFILKLVHLKNKEEQFFDLSYSSYKDSHSFAEQYVQIFYLEALVFAATSFKIIDFLRINDYIKLFFQSVDVGITTNVIYMILIIPSFVFFSIVAHIIWGPFHKEFNTLSNSYIQILFFSIGNINLSKLLKINPHFLLMFFICFFLFQLYFLCNIFICLFAENFRQTVKKVGYPEDTQIRQWTLKDYVIWLCYFIDLENDRKNQ